jgi:hypothetical protein
MSILSCSLFSRSRITNFAPVHRCKLQSLQAFWTDSFDIDAWRPPKSYRERKVVKSEKPPPSSSEGESSSTGDSGKAIPIVTGNVKEAKPAAKAAPCS